MAWRFWSVDALQNQNCALAALPQPKASSLRSRQKRKNFRLTGQKPISAFLASSASLADHLAPNQPSSMKWITREKIKVDRVACPWLIRNFVDPEAEFVFLPPQTEWGKIDDETVFDVPNCELGHHGEDVSFNSILKKYNLTEPALLLLGEIVRAADSHPTDPHPAGEGLRWIAGGFGALGLTDHEILQREFVVYDALYAECKRRINQP
jgi:hypothetical protein